MSPSVLPACIAWGVQRGLFAYALGDGEKREFDTIYCGDRVTTGGNTVSHSVTEAECDVTDSAWLLRPALAKSYMPEPQVKIPDEAKKPSDEEEGKDTDEDEEWKKKEVTIKDGERRLDKVRIVMTVPWENWNDIYNEVIDPLARKGAEVRCNAVIIAKAEAAI